jgi:opacity protein-like surface antigen
MKRYELLVVALLICVSSNALADADIGFKGVGGRLSFVSPEDVDAAIGFGAIADLGTITPDIGLQATIDFWSKSEEEFDVESSFRDIVLGARATYNFSVDNPDFTPFVAGGLAIHLFHVEVDAPEARVAGIVVGGGSYDDSETKIGIDLAGGTRYAVSENADIIGEAMYRIVSDVSQFVISAGVIFWFGE